MTDWPRFLAIYGKEQTFALRLTHVSRTKAVYKRDKGNFQIDVEYDKKKDQYVCAETPKKMFGQILKPCTREEWKESNVEFAPKKVRWHKFIQ